MAGGEFSGLPSQQKTRGFAEAAVEASNKAARPYTAIFEYFMAYPYDCRANTLTASLSRKRETIARLSSGAAVLVSRLSGNDTSKVASKKRARRIRPAIARYRSPFLRCWQRVIRKRTSRFIHKESMKPRFARSAMT